MTFLEYLKTQTSRPKNAAVGDYVCDLAVDVLADPTPLSDDASYEDWIAYLESENAIDEAFSSFKIAWNEHQNIKDGV